MVKPQWFCAACLLLVSQPTRWKSLAARSLLRSIPKANTILLRFASLPIVCLLFQTANLSWLTRFSKKLWELSRILWQAQWNLWQTAAALTCAMPMSAIFLQLRSILFRTRRRKPVSKYCLMVVLSIIGREIPPDILPTTALFS